MWKNTLPFILAYIVLTFLVRDHIFFWDTVQLASRHAHWYYENDFQFFFLPAEIDSGHPPFFGMSLAALWKLFGRSLWVGHFFMLPFLIGIVILLFKLGAYFLGDKNHWTFLLLVFVDPVLLGQSVLVSPDVILVFFFLLGLWSVVRSRRGCLLIASIGLAAISMRGMMITFALFVFQIYRLWQLEEEKLTFDSFLKSLLPYLPSGILALIFLFFHYQHSGWIGYHADSPWAPSFERVDLKGFVKNLALMIWRLVDFGRVFLGLFSLSIIIFLWVKKVKIHARVKELIALMLILILVTTPSMLLHKYLVAHRYLLPVVLVADTLAFSLLVYHCKKERWRKLAFGFIFLGLLTGNLWVYPKQISQGWDSTLAHLPYYELQKKMMNFIDTEKIPYDQIGTDFPNIASGYLMKLSNDQRTLQTKNLDQNKYIFYSNVYNNFTDAELEEMENEWKIVKRFSNMQIEVILYQRKFPSNLQ